MNYQPQPLDTSKVVLDTEHLKLTELLAKNTHEIWALQRMSDGWTLGEQRDDTRKLHPCLIPYEDLPDSEKEYDRLTALGVIKTLLALGYNIEGKTEVIPETREGEKAQEEELISILESLKHRGEINISSLLNIQRQTINIRPHTPLLYQVLAESVLQLGEPLIAYDILAEGFKYWQDDLKLQQLMALALARSGATLKANSLLTNLVNQGYHDLETISLLARTHKDLWYSNPTQNNADLHLAAQYYQQAYDSTHDIYPGINAATLALLSDKENTAKEIAQEVKQKCESKLSSVNDPTSGDYWNLATLGESCLILQDWESADKWYSLAVKVGNKRYGDLSSTRRNAKIILDYLNQSEFLSKWFKIPNIAVFSGHLIDLPTRSTPRFPPHLETQVYQTLLQRLKELNVNFGYSSAACGSDILFLEAILELGGEIHIVLPYPQEQFIQDCVDLIPKSNWKERFLRVMACATEVSIACNCSYEENSSIYQYTNRLLHGLGKIRSQQLDTELIPFAVWDGKPGDGFGGTATMVKTWQDWGYKVQIIHPQKLKPVKPILVPELPENYHVSSSERPIMALLFADVVKYSRLNEQQIPLYIEHFLGTIAKIEAEKGYDVAFKDTWGDALYYVFPKIVDAGKFALDVCDLIQQMDWGSKGLPEDLNLRVSLHAGPVYNYINPITHKNDYAGSHVSYAARIEPITPPGKVYASKEFAAVVAADNIVDFSCAYVGQTPLAKNFGTFPTYNVYR